MASQFLDLIQKTEKKAEKIVLDAHEKSLRDIEKHRKKLENERLKKRESLQKITSEKLANHRQKLRKKYEEETEKSKSEAKKLHDDALPQIEKSIPTAQIFLLNNLL